MEGAVCQKEAVLFYALRPAKVSDLGAAALSAAGRVECLVFPGTSAG